MPLLRPWTAGLVQVDGGGRGGRLGSGGDNSAGVRGGLLCQRCNGLVASASGAGAAAVGRVHGEVGEGPRLRPPAGDGAGFGVVSGSSRSCGGSRGSLIEVDAGGEALVGGVGGVNDTQTVAGGGGNGGSTLLLLFPIAGISVRRSSSGISRLSGPDRRAGQRGHGVPCYLWRRLRRRHLGVEVPPAGEEPHVCKLVSDALDPLGHGRPGVAGEPHRHARLEVDHEAPLPICRHQAGADVLAHGQRVHVVRQAAGANVGGIREELEEWVCVVVD